MTRPHDPRRAARRRALTLVAVSLATFLAPVAHQLVAEHETCALHGEIVDVSAPAAGRAPHSERDSAERTPDATSDLHHHCAQLLHQRSRLLLPTSFSSVVPLRFAVETAGRGERPLVVGHRLYRLAPKASPPVA